MSSETLTLQNEKILPFEIGYLPQFSARKCEEELKETPESKMKGIQELRSLLQKNPQTNGIDFHDDQLVAYLRRNKYRTEDAHKQIQHLIGLNETEKSMPKGVPEEFLDLPSCKFLLLLPMRCQDGCAVFLVRWGKWASTELPFEQMKQLLMMMMAQALRDPMTQIHGLKVIHDWKGVSLKFMRFLTPNNLLLFYNTTVNLTLAKLDLMWRFSVDKINIYRLIEKNKKLNLPIAILKPSFENCNKRQDQGSNKNCFPARYKEVHIINESPLLKTAWQMIKPLLTDKIKNRVFFHKAEELFEYFPRSILLTEYGGYLEEIYLKDWTRRANKEHQMFTVGGQPNYY